MDINIIYSILGYANSVSVNKTLTQYALSEYTDTVKNISKNVASICIDTLFQTYDMNERYHINANLSFRKISMSFDILNMGVYGHSTTLRLLYTIPVKQPKETYSTTGVSYISHIRRYTFHKLTDNTRDILKDMLVDALIHISKTYKIDIETSYKLSCTCNNISFDSNGIKEIIHTNMFRIENEHIKETPFYSLYEYDFMKIVA